MSKLRLATAVGLSLLLLPLGVAPAIAAAAATTAAPVATQKATPAKAANAVGARKSRRAWSSPPPSRPFSA